MCMELVGPSRATRHAERAATETATEQSLRARVGQRTSQRQSQRDRAASQRERELAEGHAAVRYAAYVTVSVPCGWPGRARGAREPTSRASSSRPSARRCAWSGCGASRPRRSPTRSRCAGACGEPRVAAARARAGTSAPRAPSSARGAALARRELSQRPTRRAWDGCARPASAPATRSQPRTSRPPTPRSPRRASARAASTSARTCTAARSSMTRGCSTSAGCSSIANMLVLGHARTSARAR